MSGEPQYEFRAERAASSVAASLIAALDAELRSRYPKSSVYGIDEAGFESAGGLFVVCFDRTNPVARPTPVACGAMRPYLDNCEIKRMYVAASHRGRGLGRRMLRHLEGLAFDRGYRRAVLETGNAQPEAMGLYLAEGWTQIPRFGPYTDDPLSLCFEKRLGRAAARP